MTRIQLQTELDIQQLVNQLDIPTLEAFSKAIEDALSRREQQNKKQREKRLLQQLNTECVLPTTSWERFQILTAIRETTQLSTAEQAELDQLIQEEEQLRVKRVQVLAELSKLKNIPRLTLMEQMDIQPN